ncbi:hypothetical protein PQX77_020777 [Marasmius sp. AFHP31]|nr:hypothetical protein PQX77_020777 [Marasmius sp. AFHP31]
MARSHLHEMTSQPYANDSSTATANMDNCPFTPLDDSGSEDGDQVPTTTTNACTPVEESLLPNNYDFHEYDPAPTHSSVLPAETHELLHEMFGDSLMVFLDEEEDGSEDPIEVEDSDEEGDEIGGYLEVDWDQFEKKTMSAWDATMAGMEKEACTGESE